MTGGAHADREPLLGTILDGRYQIERELGRGGMGVVYEAQHVGISRKVAVKVLHPQVAREEIVLERFRREARITGALGHANIVQVTDTGTTDAGAPYLVMEYLRGESLAQMLRRSAPLAIDEAISIIIPVLSALSTVHATGVIHRDIKPENIFLVEGEDEGDTSVKVLDFGVSKPIATRIDGPSITASGTVVGTPNYMSPEQVRTKDTDHRADIYACGVILYEMLSGSRPFSGDNLGDLFVAILTEKPTPLHQCGAHVPESLSSVVHQAIERYPEDRFRSADELEEALKPFAAVTARPITPDAASKEPERRQETKVTAVATPQASPASAKPKRGLWLGIGLAGCGSLALLAVGWTLGFGGSDEGPPSQIVLPMTQGQEEARSEDGGPEDGDTSQDGQIGEPRNAADAAQTKGADAQSADARAAGDSRSSQTKVKTPRWVPRHKTKSKRIVTDIDEQMPGKGRIITDIDEQMPFLGER